MSNGSKKNQQIQVFVRVRPLNAQEKEQKSHSIIDVPTNKEVTVRQHSGSKKFTFDRVFGPVAKQLDVYQSVVSPLIKEVLAGYNCTVFAYGQTGTGKTFTMAGGNENKSEISWQHDPEAGIIPRALSQLFDELRLLQVEHSVRVSYLELYNEELFDLLSATDDSSKLRLYEDNVKKGSVIVAGLEEAIVHNKNEVYKILQKGSEKRQTASTLMNAQSSRSHTIFSITVHTKDTSLDGGEDLVKTGKLNLVDLAGSENIGRSGAVDKRAREAGNINQSLLTLGRVITSLVERAPHVPYRESKLTRLLQDSLGGRTKTSIIATVSPAMCNIEESLSTLDYAHRAKNITNRPEVNQKCTKAALLKQYTEEIERLRRDLQATRACNGVYLAKENYDQMVEEIENYARELTDKIREYQNACNQLELVTSLCDELKLNLEVKTAQLEDTQKVLKLTQETAEERAHLIDKLDATEAKLGQQAKTLLNVVENASADNNKLHNKLDTIKSIENENKSKSEQFEAEFDMKLKTMQNDIENFFQNQKHSMCSMLNNYHETIKTNTSHLTDIYQNILKFDTKVNFANTDLETVLQATKSTNDKNNDQLKKLLADKLQNNYVIFSKYLFNGVVLKIQDYVKESEKSVDKCNSYRENMELMLNEQQYIIASFLTESEKRLKELQLFQEDKMKKNHSLNEILKKNLERRQKLLKQLLEDATSDESVYCEIDSVANSINDKIQTIVETDKISRENFSSKIDECKSIQTSCIGDFTNEMIDKEENMKSAYKNMEEDVQKTNDKLSIDICNETETLNYQIDTYQNEVDNLITSGEKIRMKITENIAHTANLTKKLNMTMDGYQHDYIYKWETNLNNLKTNEIGFEESFVDSIHNRNEELKKFISEDLTLQCEPTGVTPIRKEFKYPRYLSSTSPKDVIIERFRREKRFRELRRPEQHSSPEDENIVPIIMEEIVNCDSDEDKSRENTSSSSSSDNNNSIENRVFLPVKSASETNVCNLQSSQNKHLNQISGKENGLTEVKSCTDLTASPRSILGPLNRNPC